MGVAHGTDRSFPREWECHGGEEAKDAIRVHVRGPIPGFTYQLRPLPFLLAGTQDRGEQPDAVRSNALLPVESPQPEPTTTSGADQQHHRVQQPIIPTLGP